MQSMICNLLTVALFVTIVSVPCISEYNVCAQSIPGCEGTELECSRSITCSHGNCSQNGVCVCDLCWRGDSCDQYVDTQPPVFNIPEREIIVHPTDTEIFTAFAGDRDLWTTCEGQRPCPCADVTYSFQSGNEDDLFAMDPHTGKISRSSYLQPGTEHHLVLVASPVYNSSYNETIAEIVVRVESGPTQLPEPNPLERYSDETSLSRSKRAASSSTSADTRLNLTQVTTVDTVHVGERVNFRFEIVLPPAITMDMTVEMFTFDPETSLTAFMLCHPTVSYVGSAVASSETSNISALLPDTSGARVENRAVYHLGELQVADTSDVDERTVVIEFGVSLIVDPQNVVNNEIYRVVAGAEYDNATYVMIGQAELTANTTTDSTYYSSNFVVDEVGSIAIDDFVILKGHFYTTKPFGDVTVESFSATNNRSISYSVGSMRVSSAGPNYCRRYNLMEYNASYFSLSENAPNYRGSLFIPALANCDGDRSWAIDTGNEMVIEVAVLVPNDVDIVGEVLHMAVTATVDPTTYWTHVVDIPILSRTAQTMKDASLKVLNDSLSILSNGVAFIVLDVILQAGSYSNVVIELLAPDTVSQPPTMSACSFKLRSKGFNVLIQPGYSNIGSSRSGQENVTDRVVANFGRVINTGQLPSTNTSANKFTLEFAVTALSDSIVGPVVINLKNSETDATAIDSKQIAIQVQPGPPPFSPEDLNVTISPVTDTNIYIDGSTGMLLKLFLEPETFLSPVQASFFGPVSREDPVVRVCRAEVVKVGPGLPCVNMSAINNNVAYSKMYDDSQLNSVALASVGTLCASSSNSLDSAQLLFNVALQLPRQTKAVNGDVVMFSAGILLGDVFLWTGNTNLTVRSGFANTFPDNCSSRMDVTAPSEYIAPGSAGIIYLHVVIPTSSVADHVITLTAPTDSTASICSLYIVSVGHNLPCVDQKPIPGNLSFGNTATIINYVPRVGPKDGNSKGILDFGAIANTGLQKSIPYLESDDNAILVAATVKIHDIATTNVTFKYTMDIGGVAGTSTSVVVPVSSSVSTAPFDEDVNITASAFDDDTIYINSSKLVSVDFQIPVNYTGIVSVKFSNKLSKPVLKICAAAITKVGDNLPCLNASLAIASYNSSIGDLVNCLDVAVIDLGVVCTAPISDDPVHYWVRAEASVNIVDDAAALSLGTISVDASVTVSDLTLTKTVTLTPTANIPFAEVNTSLIIVQNEFNVSKSDVKVGDTIWVGANFSFPKSTTNTPVIVVVQGPAADGRAIAVVKTLRVVAAGLNVACVSMMPEVQLLNSSQVTTSQKDVLLADLGLVTNTGMTYRRGFPSPLDDQITVEVEFMMTDHPLAVDNSVHSAHIMLDIDGDVINGTDLEVPLTVVRDKMERPAIQGLMNVSTPAKIYRARDILNLQLFLSHAEHSTAEPVTTTIRIFMPPYIKLATLLSHNVSSSVTTSGSPYLDIELSGPFLFGDIYELNLTVTVDPDNSRGFEAGITNATIVARAYATIMQRDGYPSDPSVPFSCDGFYTMFEVGGIECYDVLGLEDGNITDCQLMASTATDASHGPSFARLNLPQGQGWRPNLRIGENGDYLRVYFGNITRVSRVAIEKDTCCRAVSSVEFSYSDDGMSWTISHKELELNYTGNLALVDIPKPFESRHFKMRILNSDQPESASTMYTNIRIELYGCPVSSDISITDVCGVLPPTVFSDSVQYRHFVVNTNQDVIYVCDVNSKSGVSSKLNCFCSADGNLWNFVDGNIDRFIGFDSAENVVYAQNSGRGTYFRSSDCNQWFLVEEDKVMIANSSGNLIGSSNIPALSSDDPRVSITKGLWKSSFDGLYHNGDQKATWNDCCRGN